MRAGPLKRNLGHNKKSNRKFPLLPAPPPFHRKKFTQTTRTAKKTTTTTLKPRATDFHFFDLICRGGNYCTFVLSKIVNSPDILLAELMLVKKMVEKGHDL